MSDSRPPIYDDGGGLPDVDRSRRRTDPGTTRRRGDAHDRAPVAAERDVWDDAGDSNWRRPNYLVRRAIVAGLAVVVIAGAAVAAGRLIGGGDGGSESSLGNADWNSVVTVDSTAGVVVVTDAQGEETNRFRIGLSGLTDTELVGTTLISTDADTVGIVQLEAKAGDDAPDITTIDMAPSGTLVRPSGTVQTVVAENTSAARVVIVHGPTGAVIDTADAETVPGARYDLTLARADPTGRHVLVTDSGNFQSVLFSFDREVPSFFPGLALAVSDDVVVTASNVGTNANVNVFAHDGEPGVAAQTTSVRAGMVSDGKVVLIGIDGEILGLSLGNGDVTDIGELSIGTIESGHVAIRGDRLVVVGAGGTAIVDTDGVVIAELLGARPTTTGGDELAPRGASCLVVERAAAGEVAVIDLETGTVGAEALANPDVLTTADGCRPIVPTSSGYISLDADAVASVTITGDVVAISPDGGTVATEQSNRLELLPRSTGDNTDDDEQAEPIDVGRGGRAILFADL